MLELEFKLIFLFSNQGEFDEVKHRTVKWASISTANARGSLPKGSSIIFPWFLR